MKSQVTRRDFLKASGGVAGLFATAGLFRGPMADSATPVDDRPRWVKETYTICPYDASGCGFLCYTDEQGRLTNLEGDPNHPVNQGGACSKGAAIAQIHNNPRRLKKVKYRAPGASEWEEKEWDWAITEMAKRIKKTRDDNWIETNAKGNRVRRTEALAMVGASCLDNEECELLVKMLRGLGMVYMETQARL
ncbi:molybdopterin oxidoreductase Fe4S4 region [Dehalogenimonas lykanthroporepellens BL-DC-9]|jgi:formate dehydrogenase major subunit|nr:molybdopterin oxidoreductase Fe4S4 region [Dehalogenimonas lykanthroporepellens BL-DC-9]